MRSGRWRAGFFLAAQSAAVNEKLLDYFEWELRLFHKSGGQKKDWFWGLEDIPISKLEFEENKKLLGVASLGLTHVDFPIDIEDRFEIWYKGVKKWEGLVDSLPDCKGGSLKLVPFHKQLDERLVNYNFSSVTYESALQSIITGLDDTDIIWNADYVDTGSTVSFSKAYKYVTAKSAVKDIMKNMPNREWGVDINRTFNVYAPNSTVDEIIFNSEDKWYTELEVKNNDKRIKATRYEVFKKSTSGSGSVYVDQVGFDETGTYATLGIEKTKRRKDKKYSISVAVDDTFAKDLAYSELEGQAQLSTSIVLKNFRLDKYDANIGDYVRCFDDYERILFTFRTTDGVTEITDSTSGWGNSGGAIIKYTDDFVSGDACIQLVASLQSDDAIYDFGEIQRYLDIENISFMVNSEEDIGELLEFGLSETTASLFNNPYSIYINDSDQWELKKIIPTERSFRYLGFKLKNDRSQNRQINLVGRSRVGAYAEPSIFSEYFFDRIQIYAYLRNEYEGAVVAKKYEISKKGLNLTMELGDYDLQDNEELLDLRQEVEDIKEFNQST